MQSRDSEAIVVAQSRDCAVSLQNLEIGVQFQDCEIVHVHKLCGTYYAFTYDQELIIRSMRLRSFYSASWQA